MTHHYLLLTLPLLVFFMYLRDRALEDRRVNDRRIVAALMAWSGKDPQ
jgi:hypothetical protein